MASKYLIAKNVLKEYDDYVVEERTKWPTTTPIHFRERVTNKLVDTKKKDPKKVDNKIKMLDFVYLTEQEYSNLIIWYGTEKVKEVIERLSTYIGAKGDKYKSHYHTIIMWFQKKWVQRIDQRKELEAKKQEHKEPEKEYVPMTEEQKKQAFEKLQEFRMKLANKNLQPSK